MTATLPTVPEKEKKMAQKMGDAPQGMTQIKVHLKERDLLLEALTDEIGVLEAVSTAFSRNRDGVMAIFIDRRISEIRKLLAKVGE